jgi:hypothetical protein
MFRASETRVNTAFPPCSRGFIQIIAECPGTETRYINGLTSKSEVDEWLAGPRRIGWLRSQATPSPSEPSLFDRLDEPPDEPAA